MAANIFFNLCIFIGRQIVVSYTVLYIPTYLCTIFSNFFFSGNNPLENLQQSRMPTIHVWTLQTLVTMAGNAFTLKEALLVCVTKDSMDKDAKSIYARAWAVPPMPSAEMGSANVRKDSRVSTRTYSTYLYLIIYICEKAWTWQSATEKVGEKGRQLEIFLKEVKEEGGGIDIRSVLTFLS